MNTTDKPVRVELTPGQRVKQGGVELTPEQVRSANARLNSRLASRPKRNVPHCGCGCGLTLERALKRHPKKAFQLEEKKSCC
jgi:hypothetical protein